MLFTTVLALCAIHMHIRHHSLVMNVIDPYIGKKRAEIAYTWSLPISSFAWSLPIHIQVAQPNLISLHAHYPVVLKVSLWLVICLVMGVCLLMGILCYVSSLDQKDFSRLSMRACCLESMTPSQKPLYKSIEYLEAPIRSSRHSSRPLITSLLIVYSNQKQSVVGPKLTLSRTKRLTR